MAVDLQHATVADNVAAPANIELYGVLKGRAIASVAETEPSSPHYQVHIVAAAEQFRIAVNVKSQLAPSEVLYLVDDDFRHPITAGLPALAEGFTPLPPNVGGGGMDYIRGNLFSREAMRPLPPNTPGPDNDLNEKVDFAVQRAIRDSQAEVYAFGTRWGPEPDKKDKVFDFLPGNGIHNIHMNQGNDPSHADEDGVWHDGGLLMRFPTDNRWLAVFLAFQSQAWHTDDQTGHALATGPERPTGPQPGPGEPDGIVRIVAALANPVGPAPEAETVTLINASRDDVDLAGWKLLDRLERGQTLSGSIAAGGAKVVALAPPVQLGNSGGIITLVDAAGLKVDGVSYTKAQAAREGWTIVF